MHLLLPPAPGTDQDTDRFRTLVTDWIEVHPEDSFSSQDTQVTHLIHSLYPSHLSHQEPDHYWQEFWSGGLPGQGSPPPEEPEVIEVPVESGVIRLTSEVLDRIYHHILSRLPQRFSGLEGPDPTRSTPDA